MSSNINYIFRILYVIVLILGLIISVVEGNYTLTMTITGIMYLSNEIDIMKDEMDG